MALLLLTITVLLYLVSSVLHGRALLNHSKYQSKWPFHLALGACIFHAILLSKSLYDGNQENLSITNVASLIGWLIAISTTLASLNVRNQILLPVIYCFNILLLAISAILPTSHQIEIALNFSMVTHITIALLSYGCLTIALLYTLQFMYINYLLKHKNITLVSTSLPPLMQVEKHIYQLVSVGTVLLTLSLVTGIMFLDNMFAQGQVHKTVLSIAAWVCFVVILVGHYKLGWRGNITTIGTISGTVLLTLAYFGSRIVKELILS